MNVLSLFDGMSCAMLALERAGIKVDNYYASEVDKYAIKVSQENYPNIFRLGDINLWRLWDFPKIDLVIGGSPCQGFSFAGKQLAFDDPRSKLFFEYVAILRNIKCFNPKVKFLLENVKMKKSNLDIISEYIGVKPVFINSNLLTAQNRQRYYWCNWDVEQPEDKGILLKDILEDGFGGYAYNRNEGITKPLDKSFALNASDWRGLNRNQNQTAAVESGFTLMSESFVARQQGRKCLVHDFDKKAVSLSAMEYVKNGRQGDYLACTQSGVIKNHGEWQDRPDKSQCVDANYYKAPDNHGQRTMIKCGAVNVGQMHPHPRDYKEKGLIRVERLEFRTDEKSNACQTGSNKNLLPCLSEKEMGYMMRSESTTKHIPRILRAKGPEDKSNTITGSIYKGVPHGVIKDELHYRKLTPIECERLQGIPDNYTNHASNTQRYKMIGNGFTVDVIAHILGGMYAEEKEIS